MRQTLPDSCGRCGCVQALCCGHDCGSGLQETDKCDTAPPLLEDLEVVILHEACVAAMQCRQTASTAKGRGAQALLEANGGVLKLPLIKNKKTINPRDSSTPPVFQLETAMGSAIEAFGADGAGAVVVPRSRFAPVKTTNDLFCLRSDAYKARPLAQAAHVFDARTYAWASLPGLSTGTEAGGT
jgi:hypothetical protein